MENYIKEWVKCKQPLVILGKGKIQSIVSYEYFEFMGLDEKFYSFNILYHGGEIIGTLSGVTTLMLTTSQESGSYDGVKRLVY